MSFLLEDTLRRIIVGAGGAVDLTAPELDAPVLASRTMLLHTLALHAGLEVRARRSEDDCGSSSRGSTSAAPGPSTSSGARSS
ncbi:hypothetical protein OV079_51890 [Nannocystis pusilla]|uniref:Uncharacterized protein n=1 Tax=Nannocystis pusilla TaxID=889268 RepID=A0A9X3F0R7_9BACT|nr:hypothetical protein [Nannocystis pusilla]MCY1013894.1 hypothetical protein [Nannocystis pusilla]